MHFPSPVGDVLVVGSVNIDSALELPRLPQAGETIASSSMVERGGGKGANQAFAARRYGGSVALLAAVGTDSEIALAELRAVGVDLTGLVTVSDVPTGRAVLLLGEGDNMIIIHDGANGSLSGQHVADWAQNHPMPAVVVLQHEVSQEVVNSAIAIFSNRALVILNPSPWRESSVEAVARADVLVLNEIELAQITGRSPAGAESARSFVESALVDLSTENIVVTMGGSGALVRSGGTLTHVPAIPVEVVDTVGAGDAFLGALASAIASGTDLIAATRGAVRAAADIVAVRGARDLPRALAERNARA